MDVGNPQNNAQDDAEQHNKTENKNHVALALAGEVSSTGGSGVGLAFVSAILFHPPDGRLGAFDRVGSAIACALQLLSLRRWRCSASLRSCSANWRRRGSSGSGSLRFHGMTANYPKLLPRSMATC